MKILIVEDEQVSRKVLERYLASFGECQVATDGMYGLDMFRAALTEEPFDAVFMDILMPGLNGQEAVRVIRDLERKNNIDPTHEVKVIMASALDDSQTVREAFFKNRVAAFLVKPFTRKKVREALMNADLL